MSETQKEGKIKAEFDNRPMDLKIDQRSDEQRILDAQASVNTAVRRELVRVAGVGLPLPERPVPSPLRRTFEDPHCQGPAPGAFTLHDLDS